MVPTSLDNRGSTVIIIIINIIRALISEGPITNRPNQLTQCCTQLKSPGVKIFCVSYLH